MFVGVLFASFDCCFWFHLALVVFAGYGCICTLVVLCLVCAWLVIGGAVWLGLVYLWVSVDYVVYSFDLLCGLLFVFGLWWVFSWLGCAGWWFVDWFGMVNSVVLVSFYDFIVYCLIYCFRCLLWC